MRRRGKNIFEKERLRPSQMRTVADRRFGDADALFITGDNARANGAIYLAGIGVECLLKARLIEKHLWLQNANRQDKPPDSFLYRLCYQRHDLIGLLEHLPELRDGLLKAGQKQGKGAGLLQTLVSVASRWTISIRYSPQTATMHEAEQFMRKIGEVKPWLR